jgi:putative holliday junction resolvase
MNNPGRLLGLDLGARRIGVAVSDSAQTVATPVTFVERARDRSADHAAIAGLAADYEVVGVVVGLPVSLSGHNGTAARGVLEEVGALRSTVGVDVETIDERFTTVAASSALRRGGRASKDQRGVIDQTAAALLLQDWIDRRPRGDYE